VLVQEAMYVLCWEGLTSAPLRISSSCTSKQLSHTQVEMMHAQSWEQTQTGHALRVLVLRPPHATGQPKQQRQNGRLKWRQNVAGWCVMREQFCSRLLRWNDWGWPKPYICIYGLCTVLLAGNSPYIRSYTVCTYGFGQP